VRHYFHKHGQDRMNARMAALGVIVSDVLAVIASPTKTAPGDYGRINAWGYAANGVRIRVTYHPVTGEIRTVAVADQRFK
jgi:hypothetical protein